MSCCFRTNVGASRELCLPNVGSRPVWAKRPQIRPINIVQREIMSVMLVGQTQLKNIKRILAPFAFEIRINS